MMWPQFSLHGNYKWVGTLPCLKKSLEPWLEPGKTQFRTQVGSHHNLWHFIQTYLDSTGKS